MNFLLVALGGALGSLLRYLGQEIVQSQSWPPMWGTLGINLMGSMAIGVVAGAFDGGVLDFRARLFLATGTLGGFTTFSTFSLENAQLFRSGQYALALVNIGVSNLWAPYWLSWVLRSFPTPPAIEGPSAMPSRGARIKGIPPQHRDKIIPP